MWSIGFLPSASLSPQIPEFISSRVDSKVDAQRTITLARTSLNVARAAVDITDAHRLAILHDDLGRDRVRERSKSAGLLCRGDPFEWAAVVRIRRAAARPFNSLVRIATRPIVTTRPIFSRADLRKISSPQVNSIGGWNTLSGNCGRFSALPLMPTNFSTCS